MTNIPAKIKQTVHEELRGLYTVSIVVVESFDPETMRVRVSLKRDRDAVLDNIPLASVYADGDGYGLVPPIKSGNEGLLFHTKSPIEKLAVDAGHRDHDLGHVTFDINDAMFLPRYWNENDTTPTDLVDAYKPGDYLLAHDSDTIVHIKGSEHSDPGTTTIETASGLSVVLDEAAGEIQLGGDNPLKALLTEDAVFEYEDTQPDGSTSTKTTSTVSNDETTTDTKLS